MTEAQAARFLIEELPAMVRRAVLEQEQLADMPHGIPATGTERSRDRGRPSSDGTEEKVSAVANRIALQVFSVPSLQAFLADYAVVPTGKPDGAVRIQLDFLKLPKEIIPELEKLLSTDMFRDHKLVKYIKNGQARTGLEIEVVPKDLPGSPYDYAF
jgi:ribosomal protein S8